MSARVHRQAGSALIVAIGLTAVCVSLAFACVYISRAAVDTGTHNTLTRLARNAARAGTAHAAAELLESYARSPNEPTHYRQSWHTGFRAIDSYRAGWDTLVTSDDKPNGGENTPNDSNGNDVAADQTLTEAYTRTSSEYVGRRHVHSLSVLRTSGLGRYIEPGQFHSDLVGKPVSFHLEHPVAAAASPDPAVKAGENWTPDVDRPLYLDSDFLPVTTRSEARYRMRYAVAIEDLSGHIYTNFPGTYTKPTRQPFGSTPSTVAAADDEGARETDVALAMEWQKPFMSLIGGEWELVYGALGMPTTNRGVLGTSPAIVKFGGGRPLVLTDYDHTAMPTGIEPDEYFDAYAPPFLTTPTGTILFNPSSCGRGTPTSFETIKRANPDSWPLAYTYTPYGRGTKPVAAPREWDEGYTSCPWRINFPALTPGIALQMLYALLPVEPRTYLYRVRSEADYNGANLDGSAKWTVPVETTLNPGEEVVHNHSRLRESFPLATSPFAWRAANPYPGTVVSPPPADWAVDLGKDVDINQHFVKAYPLPGNDGLFFIHGPWNIMKLHEPWPGGKLVHLRPGGVNFFSINPGNAYLYYDSYWHDVNVSSLHTMMTGMLIWHGDTRTGWSGDPLAGAIAWPAGERLSTQPGTPASAVDTPALDRDADGDGVMESPSLLDSVEDLDRLWITNMGEYWGDFPVGSRPDTPATGIYCDVDATAPRNDLPSDGNSVRLPRKLYAFKPSNHLKSLTTVSPANKREMELILNDHRMSLFGASPQYPDFRGIDFDDDGQVWCSGYNGGRCPAESATGKGRAIDPAQGDRRFSLSGYFVFQQSHFYRAFVRGEVFDEIRQRPVAQAVLETVLTVDPDGSLYDVQMAPKPAWRPDPAQCSGLEDSQVLFQRWHHVINDSTMTELK